MDIARRDGEMEGTCQTNVNRKAMFCFVDNVVSNSLFSFSFTILMPKKQHYGCSTGSCEIEGEPCRRASDGSYKCPVHGKCGHSRDEKDTKFYCTTTVKNVFSVSFLFFSCFNSNDINLEY